MRFEQYLQLSSRTAPEKSDLFDVVMRLDEKVLNLVHASLGVSSEISELAESFYRDHTNTYVKGELGDICWFAALGIRMIGGYGYEEHGETGYRFYTDREEIIHEMHHNSEIIQTSVKAKMFYDRPLDEDMIKRCFSNILLLVKMYALQYRWDISDIFKSNISKLKERWPDKFSTHEANNRNLEREDKAIGV